MTWHSLLPSSGPLLGLVLVALSTALSWVLGLALGGFKIGKLERRLELALPRDHLSGFLLNLHQRATGIGFRQEAAESQMHYRQGGKGDGELGGFTHAKTLKQLTVAVEDVDPSNVRVTLALCYLDPIVGDTGESAYRDAVLNFVSGQADAMLTVPNRSFAAFTTFVGGLFACGALYVLHAAAYPSLLATISVLTVTTVIVGIQAIVAISRRRAELTGIGLATIGIITSFLATGFAVVLVFQ